MKLRIFLILCPFFLFVISDQCFAQVTSNELEARDFGGLNQDDKETIVSEKEGKLEWWREARFGCFVHWGAYSQLGNQWNGKRGGGYSEHIQRVLKISMADYKADAVDKFNPVNFNADEWIDLVKRAGMRYFIITAKHHDGFAMYDSKVSEYNIVKQTPWGIDPMEELKSACDKKNIKMGFYYSHAFDWGDEFAPGNDWEWKNPGGDKGLMGGRNWYDSHPEKVISVRENYIDKKSIPQIEELIKGYNPALMWFDTPHKIPDSENRRILDFVRNTNPDVIVNGRLVRQDGDYINTGDRAVEFRKIESDWESIPTTNESYGWNPLDSTHKSSDFLIKVLAKAVSRGGNVLLNIGPRGDGSIDPKDVEILEGIGKWMTINEEAIHGCNGSPLPPQPWGVITSKKMQLYLHIFDWPKESLIIGGLKTNPRNVILLTSDGEIKLESSRLNEQDVIVSMPEPPLRLINSVIKMEFDQLPEGGDIQLLDNLESNRLLAYDATLHRGDVEDLRSSGFGYGDGKADNYTITGWRDKEQWISWRVRVNEPQQYKVSLRYGICKGGEYILKCGHNEFKKVTPSVEGTIPWIAKTNRDELGTLFLPAGIHQIELYIDKSTGEEVFRPLELFMTP